jgi:hypothetical protein
MGLVGMRPGKFFSWESRKRDKCAAQIKNINTLKKRFHYAIPLRGNAAGGGLDLVAAHLHDFNSRILNVEIMVIASMSIGTSAIEHVCHDEC